MRRLLAALGLAGLAVHHAVLIRNHRERIEALERDCAREAAMAARERALLDQLYEDFDRLLVVTLPVASKAPDWLALLETRPGVVGGRANLQAWLAAERAKERES